MIGTLALLTIASIRGGQGPEPDVKALLQTARSQCAGSPAGPACLQIRIQLERALFRNLTALYLAGERLDRETLRVAARAGTPELAAFGLRRLADAPRPEDALPAAEGLDSPFPAVRSAAAELAHGLEDRSLKVLAGRVAHRSSIKGTGLLAEEAPAAKSLGVAPYPGARFRFAASQPGMAVFTTADPADKVLAFYAKGRKALSGEELKAQRRGRPSKGDEQALAQQMMAELMKGRDPQQVAQEMGQSEQARQADWTKGIEGEAGITAPRYLVLEEAGSQRIPVRVLAVYRDEAFGSTAFAFRSMPKVTGMAPAHAREDAAYTQALMELMQRQD
jgi:hypothetical protein